MDSSINFYYEEVDKPSFFNEKKISDWIKLIVKDYHKSIQNISYIFCSDEYILKINQEYLNHNDYTDTITFPYQQGEVIESDIFISLDRVIDNSSLLNQDLEEELHRVVIHGILHLCGLKDKTQEDSEKMRIAEEKALNLLQNNLD